MSRKRLLVVFLAVVCAAAAVFLAQRLLTQRPVPPPVVEAPKVPTVEVLTAATDIAMGGRLGSLELTWRAFPRSALGPQMITRDKRPNAIAELRDSRARMPIITGEPITTAKTVKIEGGGFMSAVLPQGMRAIAVTISDRSAVAGFILPNDRVDVIQILTRSTPGSDGGALETRTILGNVRVLAVNRVFAQQDDQVNVPELATAVLELTLEQAEAAARAQAMGELQLALRSLAEEGDQGLRNAKPTLNQPPDRARDVVIVRYGIENRPQQR